MVLKLVIFDTPTISMGSILFNPRDFEIAAPWW